MCDYSAKGVKQRAAAQNDKLITRNISTHTRGFGDLNDPQTAVCLRPGTELAFDSLIKVDRGRNGDNRLGDILYTVHKTARFRQVNKNEAHAYHDALELPDGKLVMLQHLLDHQTATVLQLPAEPRTPSEAAEQERAAYV